MYPLFHHLFFSNLLLCRMQPKSLGSVNLTPIYSPINPCKAVADQTLVGEYLGTFHGTAIVHYEDF
jgi:hypothetical protein